MSPDPEHVAEVHGWLQRARRDLEAAAFEATADPAFTGDMVFHAQQAVEKSLKAFLALHGQRFRKTHNLVELGEACAAIDGSLDQLLRRAAPLTEYAWRFRYPGEPEDPSLDEAAQALAVAREVFEAILSRLPAEMRP